jgi:hypothetical protein
MLKKIILVEGYEFILNYFDKELLDQQKEGRVLAFCINYTPKSNESEYQTTEILERFEDDFLFEINEIINKNPDWYNRFELSRDFDGGWTGGYNNVGQQETIHAHRYLVMRVKE